MSRCPSPLHKCSSDVHISTVAMLVLWLLTETYTGMLYITAAMQSTHTHAHCIPQVHIMHLGQMPAARDAARYRQPVPASTAWHTGSRWNVHIITNEMQMNFATRGTHQFKVSLILAISFLQRYRGNLRTAAQMWIIILHSGLCCVLAFRLSILNGLRPLLITPCVMKLVRERTSSNDSFCVSQVPDASQIYVALYSSS